MSAVRKGDWFRQMGVSPSDEDLNEMKKVFMSLPSYEKESISTNDIGQLIKVLHMKRSPEQIRVYQVYWENGFGDRLNLDDFLIRAAVMHDTGELMLTHAKQIDKDGDGRISAKEFKELLEAVKNYDPNFGHRTYEDFVAEADTNKDGLVSVEELAAWIGKYTKVLKGDSYRESGVPPSETELEQMKNIFKGMPSYKNDSISINDIDNLTAELGMKRSTEQLATVQDYFDKNFEGRFKLSDFLESAAVVHDRGEFAEKLALRADQNGDGLICEKEFADILNVTVAYAPEIAGTTYDTLLKQADTTKDGLVSVDELAVWFNKHIQLK